MPLITGIVGFFLGRFTKKPKWHSLYCHGVRCECPTHGQICICRYFIDDDLVCPTGGLRCPYCGYLFIDYGKHEPKEKTEKGTQEGDT